MRINYDFLDLEAFLAVKETGSFHLAAERLHLSQSSVTRRIRKLEASLNTLLFERTTRDVRPTLAAKRLQLRAEAILQEARETTRAMRDENAAFAHQRARVVTLATIPTLIAGLVAPAIKAYRTTGQGARIRVLDLAANEVAEAVAQGDADYGIGSVPMLEPTTTFTTLFNDPIVVAMPTGHPLAKRRSVPWEALRESVLILPARGTGNRLVIDETLAKNDVTVTWDLEVSRTSTALDLVAQGIGVAPLPKIALHAAQAARVTWRPLIGPDVLRPVGILSRLGQTDTTAAQALRQAIEATVAEQILP